MIDILVSKTRLGGPMTQVFLEGGEFQSLKCPICQDDSASILLAEVRAGNLTSMESAYCRSCEHRYFRKMPGLTWLNRYYAEEFDGGRQPSGSVVQRFKQAVKSLPGVEAVWKQVCDTIGREHRGLRQLRAFLEGVVESDGNYFLARPDIRKVLEIGCGYGSRLALFRRLGYDTLGVEANRMRALACRNQGLKVFDCSVNDLGPICKFAPYDFAYSVHVLEHMSDVPGHFAQLSKLVRERGFVYIQVPNLWSGEMFVMQSHMPVHCHTFSAHSLCQLMMQHGFSPVRIQADYNLHVLATKVQPNEGLPLWKEAAPPAYLLEWLSGAQLGGPSRYRLLFDHAQIELKRLEDSQTVYKRNTFFRVQELPYRHSVEFSFRVPDGKIDFPVRFLYEGDRPPVWVKRQ